MNNQEINKLLKRIEKAADKMDRGVYTLQLTMLTNQVETLKREIENDRKNGIDIGIIRENKLYNLESLLEELINEKTK